MLDLSDQGREAEQMTEKREREERKERRTGGKEEEEKKNQIEKEHMAGR